MARKQRPRKRQSAEQQFRAVARKVLARVARDPAFRKELLDNPSRALAAAGFEAQIEAIQWPTTGVAVDCKTTCGYRSCTRTCIHTCRISCRVVASL